MRRPLLDAAYRIGAVPPWLQLLAGPRWQCGQCGAVWDTGPDTLVLIRQAEAHECENTR